MIGRKSIRFVNSSEKYGTQNVLITIWTTELGIEMSGEQVNVRIRTIRTT